MSRLRRLAIVLLVPGLLSAPALASASVLYKCSASDGSIAYTSTQKGFAGCKAISTFADAPKPKPAAVPRLAPVAPHAAPEAAPKRGWVYQENTREPIRADFSDVVSDVASEPAAIVRVNFAAVSGGVASSARIVVLQDFSTVLADVASSAPTVGNPLFIAAPYRTPARTDAPGVAALAASTTVSPAPRVLRGAVYKVARKDGITEYTNIKPNAGAFAVLFTYIATCVACDVHSKIDFARTALNLEAYQAEIAAAAADYGVDSALLRAVIHAESAFNPLAISNKGAQGLMQLMPDTAGDLGVTDAFDVAQNIRGGARYLAQLLKNFNGDAQLATAAYNAGAGAVQRYHGVPPYDETQVYVQRVATLRDRYQKAL
ncbi:lytic transglycosylase domain-containing protein [Dokdonella soli]|uniref:Lytic transglycosylase domain-containing protein n=1 Tax=Dokdonella soli TaxID=529810 RepID=A0ABN1IV88_9GAMM